MNLKDIVCDFEYAEKLYELGLRKEPIFMLQEMTEALMNSKKRYNVSLYRKTKSKLNTPTFTVAELGEMLPKQIYIGGEWWNFESSLNNKNEITPDYILYSAGGDWLDSMLINEQCDSKEANARAKLLIWLIENNYVKVEDLTK